MTWAVVAVIVDVLRAYSFTGFALAAGAERLILMDDLDGTLAVAGPSRVRSPARKGCRRRYSTFSIRSVRCSCDRVRPTFRIAGRDGDTTPPDGQVRAMTSPVG